MNTSVQFSSLLVQEAHSARLRVSAENQTARDTRIVNIQHRTQLAKRIDNTLAQLKSILQSAKSAAPSVRLRPSTFRN